MRFRPYSILKARRRRCEVLRSWRRCRSHELRDPRRLLGNHRIPCLKRVLDSFRPLLIQGNGQQVFSFIQGKVAAFAVVRDMLPARRRRVGRGGR